MRFVHLLLFFILFQNILLADITSEIKQIKQLESQIQNINNFLNNPNNLWIKKYSNYKSYQQISFNISKAQEEIQKLQNLPKTIENQTQLNNLQRNLIVLQNQINLLGNYKDTPFIELIEPKKPEEAPNVTNALLIINALSYLKKNNEELKILQRNYENLQNNLDKLQQKEKLLQELLNLYQNSNNKNKLSQICNTDYCLFSSTEAIFQELKNNSEMLRVLENTKNIFTTTLEIFSKEVEEINTRLTTQIKAQIIKSVYIIVAILILLGVAFFIKLGVRKYIHDNERIYTTNKIINFLNITLIILILLFAYLDNVSYLVTVLGFASAGLAIAMKDLFMSILGWIVIVVGGAVHAGDRIKVIKEGAVYVGDVLDISILRITLYEDITLTTYTENRRAGRVIFIPNNFVFTTMFSNYTHGGIKTVWDGIDFTITFDSDHSRACHIARECAKKYAKGYTESTRKQFNKLRDRYTLKNTNVEPRVFSLLEQNGIRISVWYLTNAYATLALRSTISAEIIDLILKEPNIKIAYPSTTVYEGSKLPSTMPKTDGSIPIT
ncbi:Mechanosensitive ion channel membrane protein [Helicobacter pullorum]|uniref:mechanosensitive ion channel domain-containing protein n=1 Tax=Helicobacter pullorum TaxID=35818 RepID=UPI000CF12B29|nr:mechanosensitive ion channel domain-containing protein [Helicobacter pullorum]VEJ07043.1 Mechanosensitive ion channel membrane protein [Helicobacter pullorum]